MTKLPYSLRIKSFENRGKRYFFDIDSSFFAEMDELLEAILELVPQLKADEIVDRLEKRYSKETIVEYLNDITGLIESGELGKGEVKVEDPAKENRISNLWLNISHACNLNCVYCFGDGGDYGMKKELMTVEKAKECIDFWYKAANKELFPNVVFFGGEPHMNKEVLLFAVNYINELYKDSGMQPQYCITTNGTIFDDELIELYKNNKIAPLISIDGDELTHNSNRPFNSGKGSYAAIAENVAKLSKEFGSLRSVVTLTKENVASFEKTVRHLWEMGFDSVTFNPVNTDDKRMALSMEDIELLRPQVAGLTATTYENIKNRKPGILNNVVKIVDSFYKRSKNQICAVESNSGLVFVPDGTIYKCHRFFDDDNFKIGGVKEGIDREKQQTPIMKTLEQLVCKDCWIKNLCGGGCAKDNEVHTKDINSPSEIVCALFKMITEEGARLYIELYENEDWYFDMVEKKFTEQGVVFI